MAEATPEGGSEEQRRPEALEALLEACAARVGKLPAAHLGHVEREAVDRDEVAVVVPHRADQAGAVEGADLDVALAGRSLAALGNGPFEARQRVHARGMGQARRFGQVSRGCALLRGRGAAR